jgi:uncharacterized protein (DUF1800 family)/fibronectin type 3 domain-containing protein
MVTLGWQAAPGAIAYVVFKSTTWTEGSFVEIATVATAAFVDAGLTNGTTYYYRIRTVGPLGFSALSPKVSAKPVPPPPGVAPDVTAAPGNARVTLSWPPIAGATAYRIYTSTTGAFNEKPLAKVTATSFKHSSLTNGTAYSYRVAGYNMGGEGPLSPVVTATPVAPPLAITQLTAVAGDREVRLSWPTMPAGTSFSVYRSTRSGRYPRTPMAADLVAAPFVDATVENGPTYYYTLIAKNAGGESPRSNEASATPEGPPLVVDADTTAAFRVLRQTTWGPSDGDVEHLKEVGVQAFLDEQMAAAPSEFPDTLFNASLEASQEHFMRVALTGSDQLRQRVAWALHKIWVVSAVEVPTPRAMVSYYRLLLDGAFGNYRDLMRNITLNPAMGRYLNMLDNRSEVVTGVPPNENYARELMQLFTLGTVRLNVDGSPVLGPGGAPVSSYTEHDVKALARILTGWTFGDGNPDVAPTRRGRENHGVPMEPVEAYHDAAAKIFLNQEFIAGRSARDDLERALDVLFYDNNVAPFVSKQLIQQLVTSNPSPSYVADIAAVFADNGTGVRGDLAAVIRAIVMHPEAQTTNENAGKLSEPVLFVVSTLRALRANVADHPFMSDKAEEMGQKVFYPPSVFSYFSPGYRVRGTAGPAGPLLGPEFQILTSVTALVRANFVGSLIAGHFGASVSIDDAEFIALARDAAALVDRCNLVFMGGRMSADVRREVIGAVRASSVDNMRERVRTALYLTLAVAQAQVDR